MKYNQEFGNLLIRWSRTFPDTEAAKDIALGLVESAITPKEHMKTAECLFLCQVDGYEEERMQLINNMAILTEEELRSLDTSLYVWEMIYDYAPNKSRLKTVALRRK